MLYHFSASCRLADLHSDQIPEPAKDAQLDCLCYAGEPRALIEAVCHALTPQREMDNLRSERDKTLVALRDLEMGNDELERNERSVIVF